MVNSRKRSEDHNCGEAHPQRRSEVTVYSMKMNSRVALLLALTSVAVLLLPSVSAGGYYCKNCPSNPLQSPAACNMSSPDDDCVTNKPCYAVTAELMNGTLVSTRGCFTWTGSCNNTACEQVKNQTGTEFKHCIADCCETQRCNQMVPAAAFMSTPTPTSSSVTAVSSIAPSGTTPPDNTATQPSSSTMKKGLRYLLVLLPTVIFVLK